MEQLPDKKVTTTIIKWAFPIEGAFTHGYEIKRQTLIALHERNYTRYNVDVVFKFMQGEFFPINILCEGNFTIHKVLEDVTESDLFLCFAMSCAEIMGIVKKKDNRLLHYAVPPPFQSVSPFLSELLNKRRRQ